MTEIYPEGKVGTRPVITEGERIITSYPANHTQGKRAVVGKLHVTTNRLVFTPNRDDLNNGAEAWEIPIRRVQAVESVKPTFNLFQIITGTWHPRLAITTTLGDNEVFEIDNVDRTIAEINDYIKINTP